MRRYRTILVIFLACPVLVLPSILGAQVQRQPVPRVVRYNGTLMNADGSPRGGTIGVSFAIYADERSTAPL